eukprot:6433243-Amphidinium_carterae.2
MSRVLALHSQECPMPHSRLPSTDPPFSKNLDAVEFPTSMTDSGLAKDMRKYVSSGFDDAGWRKQQISVMGVGFAIVLGGCRQAPSRNCATFTQESCYWEVMRTLQDVHGPCRFVFRNNTCSCTDHYGYTYVMKVHMQVL